MKFVRSITERSGRLLPERDLAIMKPLRIMHLRASPFLGSPERLLVGRARAYDEGECAYLVGIFDEAPSGNNPFYQQLTDNGIGAFLLEDPIAAVWRNVAAIVNKIHEFKPHIICSHDYKSNAHALVVGKITGIPLVTIFHGRTRPNSAAGRFYQWLDDKLLRYFDGIGCVSSKTQDLVRRKAPGVMTKLVVNAIDVDETIRLSEEPLDNGGSKRPSEKWIVFAGRLNAEKGVPYLIEAAALVRQQHSSARFMIIGNGPERRNIERSIQEKGLAASVKLLGFKSNVFPWIRCADIVVLPSLTEGMPVVLLEAFALGKPVVATWVGGVPEVVEDGVTGLLVPSQDSGALAGALHALLADEGKAAEMGKRGTARVSVHNSFAGNKMAYLRMYREVVAKASIRSSRTVQMT